MGPRMHLLGILGAYIFHPASVRESLGTGQDGVRDQGSLALQALLLRSFCFLGQLDTDATIAMTRGGWLSANEFGSGMFLNKHERLSIPRNVAGTNAQHNRHCF